MRTLVLYLGILLPFVSFSQKTITGKVFDATTHQPLSSASIIVMGSNTGTTTSADGTFTLKVENNIKSFAVSYVGYEMKITNIDASVSNYLIGLKPALDEVSITVIGS